MIAGSVARTWNWPIFARARAASFVVALVAESGLMAFRRMLPNWPGLYLISGRPEIQQHQYPM